MEVKCSDGHIKGKKDHGVGRSWASQNDTALGITATESDSRLFSFKVRLPGKFYESGVAITNDHLHQYVAEYQVAATISNDGYTYLRCLRDNTKVRRLSSYLNSSASCRNIVV
jgi:hypothetical protein